MLTPHHRAGGLDNILLGASDAPAHVIVALAVGLGQPAAHAHGVPEFVSGYLISIWLSGAIRIP